MSLETVGAKLAQGVGESGRIRENQNAILPNAAPNSAKHLRLDRENRENNLQPYTCAGAHARARTVELDRETSPFSPILPRPDKVTVLKHCRCLDCRKFSREGKDYFCSEYIGGTAVVWATGRRFCDPPPDAWHYCACYHGPQISKDVWVWPRHGSAEVATGPSSPPAAEYRGGNGSEGCVFRFPAHAQGKEA